KTRAKVQVAALPCDYRSRHCTWYSKSVWVVHSLIQAFLAVATLKVINHGSVVIILNLMYA
ncbi:MAG: hypothetical protein V7K69_11330, partial [Nostoc sp.]|uniref:hypothetical protein n=1 Tax=Nostoc sp. TaxID=1180 RepID=UPI002FFD2D52